LLRENFGEGSWVRLARITLEQVLKNELGLDWE
jgi:hypothetical protein